MSENPSPPTTPPAPSSNDRWRPALPALVVLMVVGVAAPFWDVPLNRDQGVYATCADALLQGGAPYLNCWDTKGPAHHYTYALSWLVFGPRPSSPYILNALVIAATAMVIASLAMHWMKASPGPAYAAGALYGLLTVTIRYDMNAQPESFATLWAMLGLAALTAALSREPPDNRHQAGLGLLAGALLMVAVLYKYSFVLPFGVAALGLLATYPGQHGVATLPRYSAGPLRKRLIVFAAAVCGGLGLAALIALMLQTRGALTAALDHVRFLFLDFPRARLNPTEYAIRSRIGQQTLLYLARLPLIYAFGLAGCALAAWRRRWYGPLLLAYLVAGLLTVYIQQRFTPYYWIICLPPIALGMAALAQEINSWSAIAPRREALLGGLAVLLIGNTALFAYVEQWGILGGYLSGAQSREEFYESQGVWDHQVAAEYIRTRTDGDDPIWIWGHHTAIYHLAGRRSPTRFIYNEPLLMRIENNPWQAGWRTELLEDLYADPPVYLLLTTFDRTYFDFENPNVSWANIPEYKTLTDTYYVREYGFGRFEFYRLIPYWSRLAAPDQLNAVTSVDLEQALPQAEVLQESDPAVRLEPFALPGEAAYTALLMQPEARIRFRLTIPPGPVCFRADLAMFPDSWGWGGDGASFMVEVDAGEQPERVFEHYISNSPEDQHWHAILVDLSHYAGQTVDLDLATGPGPAGDYTGDWAGWGMPRLVQPPDGSRCDTNAIVRLP